MSLEDEKIETLNRLKREKDIKSLLREYHFLPDIPDPESDISPFPRSQAFIYLKDFLDQIDHAWNNFELPTKEYAIEFLKEVNNRESLLILTKCLLKEDINDIQLQIIASLKCSEQLQEIKDFFYESIENISISVAINGFMSISSISGTSDTKLEIFTIISANLS